jgi:hypothetical protein
MKGSSLLLLTISGLPLLAYPFILLAGVMSLAGERTDNEPTGLVMVALAFLIGSLAYPFCYIPCLIATRNAAKNQNIGKEKRYAQLPMIYLIGLVGLMFLWLQLEV